MALSRHVDADELLEKLGDASIQDRKGHSKASLNHYAYDSRYSSSIEIPKYRIPEEGAPADTAYQLLKDELDLDGKPNLNLASFVGTWMSDQGTALFRENLAKNLADADEYPSLMTMHTRCISMLATLWGVKKGEHAIGTACTGSSEAIHLGGLAMKRRWQEKRMAQGKDTLKPNIIMGANAQVALEKFARYFDVEARILPVTEKSRFVLDPDLVSKNIDENTIGVFVILGSTYTGHYEAVEEISNILDQFEKDTGHDIPIHVDGASGAFVAPFTDAGAGGPKWNFELERVKSINTSGHKFGLVYAGLGWVIWRDEAYLPDYLKFELHYLGGTEISFSLNFSRPGAQVICQLFNFLNLGFNGYRNIMENCLANARILSKALEASGWYVCVSDVHRKKGEHTMRGIAENIYHVGQNENSSSYNAGLPVVAFRFTDEFKREYPHVHQSSVSTLLRAKQYIIPNYALPPTLDQIEILRVVVRETMSRDLLDRLFVDIIAVTQTLIDSDEVDLTAFAGGNPSRIGHDAKSRESLTQKPMGKGTAGVHRSTC